MQGLSPFFMLIYYKQPFLVTFRYGKLHLSDAEAESYITLAPIFLFLHQPQKVYSKETPA